MSGTRLFSGFPFGGILKSTTGAGAVLINELDTGGFQGRGGLRGRLLQSWPSRQLPARNGGSRQGNWPLVVVAGTTRPSRNGPSARAPAAATSMTILVFRPSAGLGPVATRVSAPACAPRELLAVTEPRLSWAAHSARKTGK